MRLRNFVTTVHWVFFNSYDSLLCLYIVINLFYTIYVNLNSFGYIYISYRAIRIVLNYEYKSNTNQKDIHSNWCLFVFVSTEGIVFYCFNLLFFQLKWYWEIYFLYIWRRSILVSIKILQKISWVTCLPFVIFPKHLLFSLSLWYISGSHV